MAYKRQNPIPESKLKSVKELGELINKNKTILIASIKNLPGAQFQEIGKALRTDAVIKVPKKNLFSRAVDSKKNEALKKLENYYKDATAILFSDMEAYQLAAKLLDNKSPAKAKPGQKAPMDIEIQAGMTELVPGPAISELGAVGLQVKVTNGKLEIREPKVIVKEGQPISQKAADVMSKLDIKPFSIGFIPVAAIDIPAGKVYTEININPEEAVANLKELFSRALPFAVSIGYTTKDTISFILQKAERNAIAMTSFTSSASTEEKSQTPETKIEEASETEVKSEEVSGEEK